MTILLDKSNASTNPTSLLWCSWFMMLISRMISSRDEPLPLELSRMYLAACTFCDERSVTFLTTPNFPLVVKKKRKEKKIKMKEELWFLCSSMADPSNSYLFSMNFSLVLVQTLTYHDHENSGLSKCSTSLNKHFLFKNSLIIHKSIK